MTNFRERMKFDAARILERMAAGEFSAQIARDSGVSKQAVSKRLLRCAKDEYRAAMRQGAAIRLLGMLRRSRDVGDVPRKALRREVLYVERQAPHLLILHGELIQDAKRRAYAQSRGWLKPSSGSREPPQNREVVEELAALDRWHSRYAMGSNQAES